MSDGENNPSDLPPTELDLRGGARIHKGIPITKLGRTGDDIEKDFEEEQGDSLDNPAYLRKQRKNKSQRQE